MHSVRKVDSFIYAQVARSDLDYGATKARLKARAQRGLLRLRHARLSTFPAILLIGLIPATDDVIVHVEKLCDLGAALPIVEQQHRICPRSNAVVFALATHASLKLKAL